MLKVTGTLPARAAPVPGSSKTVAVIVWLVPTRFCAVSGESWMYASTYVLVAGPLPPGPALPEVDRVTVTPPIVTTAVALAVKVPVVPLLIVSVQVAEVPDVVPHVLLDEDGRGPTLVEIVMAGVPVPLGKAVAVMVKVWEWLISLMAFAAMEMAASTTRNGSVPQELEAPGLRPLGRSPL